jgi:HlyD family secretion protein
MENKKRFYKRWWFWGLIIVIVIVGLIIVKRGKTGLPEFSSAVVQRIDLVQSVEETGSVVADLKIEYGWETNGRVAQIQKKIGDTVVKDDVIAQLNSVVQSNGVAQANATLAAAQARLNERLAGPSNEDNDSSIASVSKARASLEQSQVDYDKAVLNAKSTVATKQNALETAKNNLQLAAEGEQSQIVEDAYDDLMNDIQATIPTLGDALTASDNILGIDNKLANDAFENVLSSLNANALSVAKASYNSSKTKKVAADQAVAVLNSASLHSEIEDARVLVDRALSAVQLHLIDTQAVLDATLPTGDLSQTALNTYKTNINTAKALINTDRTGVTNSAQAVTAAKNSLSSYEIVYEKAKQDLQNAKDEGDINVKHASVVVDIMKAAFQQAQASHDSLVAVPREVDVAALRADIANARAKLAAALHEFEKTKLRALTDGVLASLKVEIGENITANVAVVKIISSSLSIDVDISESDIAKVSLGDSVEVTLDAFGEERIFRGKVVSVEPAETEISGVIYYTAHIALEGDDLVNDVRPGMTANVKIVTDTKDGVLVVPQRAVIEKNAKKIVRVVKNKDLGKFEEVEVTTGLRGDEGNVEIVSGLEEGQEIVTFLKENEK